MKKALFTILQFFLFFILFAVGSLLWHPFHLQWGITVTSSHVTHYFLPDGLLLALGVLVAILAIQALRKRLCNTPWTIMAFVAAIGLGYALQLGFVTHEMF